jgi:hypothetical protein
MWERVHYFDSDNRLLCSIYSTISVGSRWEIWQPFDLVTPDPGSFNDAIPIPTSMGDIYVILICHRPAVLIG